MKVFHAKINQQKENNMKQGLWKHKKKYKGNVFFANYEYNREGKRIVKMKNVATGRELPTEYKSVDDAKERGGFVKIEG